MSVWAVRAASVSSSRTKWTTSWDEMRDAITQSRARLKWLPMPTLSVAEGPQVAPDGVSSNIFRMHTGRECSTK